MNTEFFAALEALEREKGIPKEYMEEKVEAALLSAFKRDFAGHGNVRVVLDDEEKEIHVLQLKTVVEEVTDPIAEISLDEAQLISKKYEVGSIVEVELKTKDFGRISAQTGKQVIIQGIREAERGMMLKEYESKKEELITAQVYRIDPQNGNVVLDLGKNQATLMKGEQIPGERFEEGQRVKVYVIEVRRETRGPLVSLSRTHPGLVRRLFEMEVPEIQDGTILIHGIAREAGSRTKISVSSRNPEVDPVGACIGTRGLRIANILNELSGEKIDIVKFDEDVAEYIRGALAPSEVISVELSGERSCRVVVPNDQLSLAIGKEGQNARLAAKLTGFKIDIKTS